MKRTAYPQVRRAVIAPWSEHHERYAHRVRLTSTKLDSISPSFPVLAKLVCDNQNITATHKTPAIRDWLARHPRFHLHFTPTGSSWINQVDRWFGLLTEQLIRRGVHKSIVALENDVRQWIKLWNDGPKPFRWTKTADDVI